MELSIQGYSTAWYKEHGFCVKRIFTPIQTTNEERIASPMTMQKRERRY
jgi:hypothetical protein